MLCILNNHAETCTYRNLSSIGVVSDMVDFNNPGQYQWFDVSEVIQVDFNHS